MQKTYSEVVNITESLIISEARHTGDYNPLHIDEEYSKRTIFKSRIAHATILIGRISKILAMDFPGAGCVLLNQSFDYKKPIYIGDEILVTMKLYSDEGNRCIIEHKCFNQKEEVVLDGKSILMKEAIL